MTWGRPLASAYIATARVLRRRLTRQEAKLWAKLKLLRPQGLHMRRQVPIGAAIVDFACLKSRLVVELDGGQHGHPGHLVRDEARDAALRSLGFTVLRFWNAEVDRNADGVVETILAAAARSAASRHTPPLPLP